MQRMPVQSSSLESVGFDAGVLEVSFRNGGLYRYFDVPVIVFLRLLRAESKGRFFNLEIRDAYRSERVRQAQSV